jgi:AhpD family alkylhydroperoxidase
MQTILPIQTERASGAVHRLLDAASGDRGLACNMIRTMAHSPRALEGYVQFRSALESGTLAAQVRERIALAVAQANLCEYSLAEHTYLAAQLGLTKCEIAASREAWAADWGTYAVLRFARDLATRRGPCSVAALREYGYTDADIIEVMAHVALNVFENYVNDVALTELDFPKLERAAIAA